MPVVRVSVLRCDAQRFEEFRAAMVASADVLVPAITGLHGCLGYDAGADPATSSLVNVSVWDTLEDAKQMDTLAPMLEQGRRFAEMGATFERPIMNYAILWSAVDAVARKSGNPA